MRARLIKLGVTAAALAALEVGGSTLASAGQKADQQATTQAPLSAGDSGNVQQGDQSAPDNADATGEGTQAGEADTDGAAQAAACNKAGVDPNASNVQYDDQTGTCSLDGSTGSGQ